MGGSNGGASSPRARRRLRQRRIEPIIPTCKDQQPRPDFDTVCYRRCNKVERSIGYLKRYRRIAPRYGKRVTDDLAAVTLGMTVRWLA